LDNSVPLKRAAVAKKEIKSIRRRYKIPTTKKFSPGEEEAVKFQLIVLKLAGYSQTQIAAALGVTRAQVGEFLHEPGSQELLVTLRQRIAGAALELLEIFTIESLMTIVDVMRTSEFDDLRLKAAAEILDRAGIPKTSRQERKVEQEEKHTLTDEGIVDALRALPPEKQEEAARMLEQVEEFVNSQAVGKENGKAP
jgi:predicted transcriptional regulator